mgnify:CR=1 FL=1
MVDYLYKEKLAKLGYTFKGEDLSSFEAEVYNLIASEFSKLERKDLERGKRNKN